MKNIEIRLPSKALKKGGVRSGWEKNRRCLNSTFRAKWNFTWNEIYSRGEKKNSGKRAKKLYQISLLQKKNSARLVALHKAKLDVAKRLIKSAEVRDGMTLEACQRGVYSVDSSMLPSKVQQRQQSRGRWQDRNLTLTTWLLIGVCAVIPGEYNVGDGEYFFGKLFFYDFVYRICFHVVTITLK